MCSSSRLMDFHIKGCKAGGAPHFDLGGLSLLVVLPLNDHVQYKYNTMSITSSSCRAVALTFQPSSTYFFDKLLRPY